MYSNKDKEIISTEFTSSSFTLLRSSAKYEWFAILSIPITDDAPV